MIWLWATASASFAISIVSKLLVDQYLTERVAIIGSFFGFQPATNSGIAFSIQIPGFQTVIILLAFILVVIVAAKSSTTRLRQIAFGMIIGGALGNIADRIRDGLVTDFLQVGTFPIFNIPDSFITVGVCLLLLELIWPQKAISSL